MLPEIKKRPIPGDDVGGASLERRGDVLVVVGVLADARALPLEADRKRSFLAQSALLLFLEELQRMPPRKTPHLLQPLDWYQCGQWLALPLDDKLVVTKGHPVE